MYSAASPAVASPSEMRVWMRDQRERFFASGRRCLSSGNPTSTMESSGLESHS